MPLDSLAPDPARAPSLASPSDHACACGAACGLSPVELLDGFRIAGAVVGPDKRYHRVNRWMCELVGLPKDALVGSHVADHRHASDPPAAQEALDDLLSGREPWVHYERVLRRPDGSALPVLIQGTALRDETGAVVGAAALVHDLSALRHAEAERDHERQLFEVLTTHAFDLAIMTDADGRLRYASPSLMRMLGYSQDDVVGLDAYGLVHPEDLPRVRAATARLIDGGPTETFRLRVAAADGTWRWVEETARNLLDTPLEALVANLRDVTAEVEAEQALRTSEARYRAIAETASEGIFLVRRDGQTAFANPRMAQMLGLPLEEVYAEDPLRLLGPAQRVQVETRLRERQTAGTDRYEVRYDHPDGTTRVFAVAATPLVTEGVFEGSLAMISDITAARHAQEQLQHSALHDALTQLPNRVLLSQRLARGRDAGGPTSVLFVDLDHFKLVNDSRGHTVGDEVLEAVAVRLQAHVRPEDTVSRFGGDEFVVVAQGADLPAARALADRLSTALSSPYELSTGRLHIGASIGIAVSEEGEVEPADLLRYADAAMYAAKAAGRGRVRVFDQQLVQQIEHQQALSEDLREALARDALAVHFQPIVDLRSGAVVGVEALSRWSRGELGPVPPEEFTAVAEMTGLAGELDRWVIGQAVRQVALLRADGALPAEAYVAINLSASRLCDATLVPYLLDQVARAGLVPQDVLLEITERAVMAEPESSKAVLHELRRHGFGIAVDDFGTGYSSLAYLRLLPVTVLKVDRSFVAGIADDADALAIITSVIDMARALGLVAVAEGVETQEQAELLHELGCSVAQGWLWSPAQSPDAVRGAGWCGGVLPAAEAPQRRGSLALPLPRQQELAAER